MTAIQEELELRRLPKIVRKQKDWESQSDMDRGVINELLDEGKGLCYVPKGTIVKSNSLSREQASSNF